MSPYPTLFVDDQDVGVHYLCSSLHQTVMGTYYNNTWSTVQSDGCSQGWFQYTFYGTGINVAASVAYTGQSYSVKLDDGTFITQVGDGSYKSPNLSDGKHTITYAVGTGKNGSLPTFDYMTVIAGPSTPLYQQTLGVDDADPSISYSGSWETTIPQSIALNSSTLYDETTHWASSIGDTLSFPFTGTSISIFGVVGNISSGNISTSYMIDGNLTKQVMGRETFASLPMLELFHTDLDAGQHTLIVNITGIAKHQSLGIDLIAYNSTLPNPTPPIVSQSHGVTRGVKASVVVGVVVGAVALLALVVAWWQRARLRRSPASKHQRLDG